MKLLDYQKAYSFSFLIIITLYRIYFLYSNDVNLYADEAQYWSWSKELAFGYYSKPPMISWLISLTTYFFGDSEWSIRISSPILHLLTSLVIYNIGQKLFDKNIGLYSAIFYITMPAVTLSSSLITTDSILLFLWACSCYCFILAHDSNHPLWWLLAGISAGLGMLSKYNMIIFLPSTLLYLWLSGRKEIFSNKYFYLTLVITILIYLPNFFWNINNNFISYRHTQDISQLNKNLFHPLKLLEFIIAQILIFGSLSYSFIRSLVYLKLLLTQKNYLLLFSYFAPFLVVITAFSLISNAYGNWAAPVYVTLTIWTIAYQYQKNKKILPYLLVFNILIMVVFYNYNSISPYIKNLPDPYGRLKNWHKLASYIKPTSKNFTTIVCDDRKQMAEMLYYLDFSIKKWNPNHLTRDHYDLTRSFDINHQGKVLMITTNHDKSYWQRYFSHVKQLEEIDIYHGKKQVFYYLYELQN